MGLESLKQILLKKASDNIDLHTLIATCKDEFLTDIVLESLEKMARPQSSMGRSANAAVTAWAHTLKNKDIEMIRDALSHHISHYKAALKNGNRQVADAHLNKIIPMMHLVAKAGSHSGGQLAIDYHPLEAWESNYTTVERNPNGKLVEGTKGLGRRLQQNPNARDKNPRAVPNYHYLEMPPHPAHPDTKKYAHHKGGYPWEEIQVGHPTKIDNKEAFLHIEDVGAKDKFEPHPFDEHPIHKLAHTPQASITDVHEKMHHEASSKWHDSEHNQKWLQSIKERHAKDPVAFMSRGKSKPPHHYEGIELKEHPAEAKKWSEILASKPQPATATATPKTTPTSTPTPAPTRAPTPAKSDINIAALPVALQNKLKGIK